MFAAQPPSSILKLPPCQVSTLFVQRLVVEPPTTAYKWSDFRHPEVTIMGAQDTLKTFKTADYYGALGAETFVVGTDAARWRYIINLRSVILAGMADIGFFGAALKDVGLPAEVKTVPPMPGAIFLEELPVTEGDIIQFNLQADGIVTMKQEAGDGRIIRSFTYDLITLGYSGHSIRFGASSTPGNLMIVKLMKDVAFEITTQPDGKSVMHATIHNIVDFSIEDLYLNDPDAPPPGGGGDRIENNLGGNSVRCYADGHIGVVGGVAYVPDAPVGPGIILQLDQHTVDISDTDTVAVNLPNSPALGMEYLVQRSYPLQVGETWQAPVLTLQCAGGQTFDDGSTSIGIRPLSQVRVTFNAANVWIVG